MGIIKKIVKKSVKLFSGCELLYKTNWYKSMFLDPNHEIYPGNVWYRKHDERNYDLVNLGSSSAKWAFDYSDIGVKAMNWAQQPQTLLEDYNLLRHYHSILRQGGYVLITIMPFTSLNKKTGLCDALKYVKLDIQGEPIEPFMFKEAQRIANYPILLKKVAIKALIKYMLGRDKGVNNYSEAQLGYNPMTPYQLDEDARKWMNGWMKQFSISDFNDALTPMNEKGRTYRVELMRTLVDFCTERGYKPIYVIPPVTRYLLEYYTPQFEEIYIYSFLREVSRSVQLLDYSKEETLQRKELYFNSFFLNKKGRKLFTDKVLNDLGL